MWSVGTILTGLLSFMNETAHTTGSISSTKAEKRKFARMSLEYNLRSPMFRKLFPEYQEEFRKRELDEQVGPPTDRLFIPCHASSRPSDSTFAQYE